MDFIFSFWWLLLIVFIIFSGLVTVNQEQSPLSPYLEKIPAHTYTRLRFKIPVFEQIYRRISIQNRSVELEFQAVTADQANVYFKSMLLYSVMNADEETIKKSCI